MMYDYTKKIKYYEKNNHDILQIVTSIINIIL